MEIENKENITSNEVQDESHLEDIICEEPIMDIEFHPLLDIIAVGLVTGNIHLYKLHDSLSSPNNKASNEFLSNILPQNIGNNNSKDDIFSCRALRFTPDGQCILFFNILLKNV